VWGGTDLDARFLTMVAGLGGVSDVNGRLEWKGAHGDLRTGCCGEETWLKGFVIARAFGWCVSLRLPLALLLSNHLDME